MPDLCGVVLGQQKGVGPGLFISCQNPRPCADHPVEFGCDVPGHPQNYAHECDSHRRCTYCGEPYEGREYDHLEDCEVVGRGV